MTLTSAGTPAARSPDDTPRRRRDARPILGRSAQALVVSLDGAAEVARGADSFVYLGGRFIRGFAIELILFVALLPVLIATIDLVVRLRRRGSSRRRRCAAYRSRLARLALGGRPGGDLHGRSASFPNGAPRPLPGQPRSPELAASPRCSAWRSSRRWLGSSPASASYRRRPASAAKSWPGIPRDARCSAPRPSLLAVTNRVRPPVPPAVAARLALGPARARPPPAGSRRGLRGRFRRAVLLLTAFAFDSGSASTRPGTSTTLFTVGYAPVTLIVALSSSGRSGRTDRRRALRPLRPVSHGGRTAVRAIRRESVRLTVLAAVAFAGARPARSWPGARRSDPGRRAGSRSEIEAYGSGGSARPRPRRAHRARAESRRACPRGPPRRSCEIPGPPTGCRRKPSGPCSARARRTRPGPRFQRNGRGENAGREGSAAALECPE